MTSEELTGENRCWPCTIANSAVGILIAGVPLAAALLLGDPAVLAGTVVWGVCVLGFTVYRLMTRGYLPLAEPVAKLTGLHEWFGPGSDSDDERHRET